MSQEVLSTPKKNSIVPLFISTDEPRLRAGWRLLLQILLMLSLLGLSVSIMNWFGLDGPVVSVLNHFVNLFAFAASVYVARRWLDKRSFESLGTRVSRRALVDVSVGFAIAFLQVGFVFTVMRSLGWLTFAGFAWESDPIPTVAMKVLTFLFAYAFVSWREELIARGYWLQTIASGTNLAWGVILTSAVFGLVHLVNPNATWAGAVGIFLAALFLAYAYVRTRQLWLPIGLHLGLNFFEGSIFGFPVSGWNVYPMMQINIHGPVLWTGGTFGPEAGLIVLPALVIGLILIHFYTANREV
jgi:uncharacterized protein